MFLGLAIICDDYFVASLEQIVEVSFDDFFIIDNFASCYPFDL